MPDRTPTGLPYPIPTDQVAGLPATFRELVELIATNVQPTGAVCPFAGAAAPQGWLICDGSAFRRVDYPALFAVIGTTYNTTDPGAQLFRVPDLRGRTLVGVGADGSPQNADTRTLGQLGGDTRLANHDHGGTTGTDWPDHSHVMQRTAYPYADSGAIRPGDFSKGVAGSNTETQWTGTGGAGSRHQHNITAAGNGTGGNMPPFAVLTYIIRT